MGATVAPETDDGEVVAFYVRDRITEYCEECRLSQKAADDPRIKPRHAAEVVSSTLSIKIKAIDANANKAMVLRNGMNG